MRARPSGTGRIGLWWLLVILAPWSPTAVWAGAPPTVFSFDQCADQYVLALSPRKAIVGLSPRARNPDSYLAGTASGLPLRRIDAETVLAVHPRLVVRYWGGDPGLIRTLAREGIGLVVIEDAVDFDGVRGNVRRVAAALGRVSEGEALLARMDSRLAKARSAWRGQPAIYLTSGGATAGKGVFMNAILEAAGLTNATTGIGYRSLSLEKLALAPPRAIVKGFFDPSSQSRVRWGPGRHGALTRITQGRTVVSLPGAWLGCPAWFAADAVEAIAAAAPSGSGVRGTGG